MVYWCSKRTHMNLDIKYKKKPKNKKEIIKILLKNRGIETKSEIDNFFSPKDPLDVALKDVGLKTEDVKKAVTRIKKAKKGRELVIVYGDYDADGISATAILWETLYKLKINCLPYIPERFSEGYGLNKDSIKALKEKNKDLGLIITVDNGITAHEAIKEAKKLGIDVIISDHHTKAKSVPSTKFIIHTTKIGGAGVSWFFAREIQKGFGKTSNSNLKDLLGLSAIGTISDQIPLLGPNRSIVVYGLKALNSTKRKGLTSLFRQASVSEKEIGIYDINFVIAPRINAMGRLEHGLDSLRLLCTTNTKRASELSKKLGDVNSKRQKIVEDALDGAKRKTDKDQLITVITGKYHEGVIGLIASKLVEEYWKPAIVISKEKEISKASARSIPGFDIIKAIREFENLIEDGGGHTMAAGFSIKTKNIEAFKKKIEKYASEKLTKDLLEKKTRVDMEIDFNLIDKSLYSFLKRFEPSGIGNPGPVFLTREVDLLEKKLVGRTKDHLKLKLAKSPSMFDGIGFNLREEGEKLSEKEKVNIIYSVDENEWNGNVNLQLKVKKIYL